jgi:hypothetical protein
MPGELDGEDGVLDFVLEHSKGCESVLDVGCGPGKYLNKIPISRRAGVDAYEPYLASVSTRTYLGRAQDVLPEIGDGFYDLVIALDFIEHLTAEDATAVVAEMKRIAARRVLVFTPTGFQANDGGYEPEARNWQVHRSGWLPGDLEGLGFTVTEWKRFSHGKHDCEPGALWGVWERR